MIEIKYTCNISKYEDVYAHLKNVSNLFFIPLSKRVDINKYSKKLIEKAQRLEAFDVNNKLVGLIAYYKNEDENILFVSNVSLLKEYQNIGIGHNLMEELKNCMREECYRKIKLMAYSEDKRAISFYANNGFYLGKRIGNQNEMFY